MTMKSKGKRKKKVTVLGEDEIKVDGGVLDEQHGTIGRSKRD